jgi:hypothetical protein
MLYNIILSLIFTIVIELIVSIFCGINQKYDILIIILANLLTNPITEFINLLIKDTKFHYPVICIIEAVVLIVEFLFYKKFLKEKEINFFLLSMINNLSSWIIGIMLNLYIGGII